MILENTGQALLSASEEGDKIAAGEIHEFLPGELPK